MKTSGNWQRDVLHIVLYVIGVVAFVFSIPDVVHDAIAAVQGMFEESLDDYYVHNRWITAVKSVLELAVALWLVRRSGFLAAKVFPGQAEAEPDRTPDISRL